MTRNEIVTKRYEEFETALEDCLKELFRDVLKRYPNVKKVRFFHGDLTFTYSDGSKNSLLMYNDMFTKEFDEFMQAWEDELTKLSVEISMQNEMYVITEINDWEGETFNYIVMISEDTFNKIKKRFDDINQEHGYDIVTITKKHHTKDMVYEFNAVSSNTYMRSFDYWSIKDDLQLDNFNYEDFPYKGNGMVKVESDKVDLVFYSNTF